MTDEPGRATPAAGLRAALAEAGRDHDVKLVRSGSGEHWSRGDVTFAALDDGVAEFRLDRAIAVAALRTPDTAVSDRGPEWVRFAPRDLDGHALDRAKAWFEAAYRRA